MVKRTNLEEEEEEERENFPLITTKVIEYLQPVMCKELLCKFPDNSAFGFDYTQSSLWSPLLPRNYPNLPHLELDSGNGVCRNLEIREFWEDSSKKKKQKKKSKLVSLEKSAKKKKSDFSQDSSKFGCFPIPTKGWDGMLKAASNHFKKSKKKKKKKDSMADVKLLNYFKCSNT